MGTFAWSGVKALLWTPLSVFKTSSTNQRDIKLITDKFAITGGIITRQTANVSTAMIINCQRRLCEHFYQNIRDGALHHNS